MSELNHILKRATVFSDSGKEVIAYYDSLEDYFEEVYNEDLIKEVGYLASQRHPEKWTGCKSYTAFPELMRKGDLIEAREVETAAEFDKNKTESRFSFIHDVSGAFVDVGVFMSGEPECMVSFGEVEQQNSYVTLVFEMFESARIDRSALEVRAQAVKSVVDTLEGNGVRCRILSVCRIKHSFSGRNWSLFIKIKDFEDPLNDNLLNFSWPSMYRVGFFAWLEQANRPYSKFCDQRGYGLPRESQMQHHELSGAYDWTGERVFYLAAISNDAKIEKLIKSGYQSVAEEMLRRISNGESNFIE